MLTHTHAHTIQCNLQDLKAARVGDTWHVAGTRQQIEPLPGFRAAKAMVYASLYPMDSEDFDALAVVRICVLKEKKRLRMQ
jgi:translation elongation factor EF-4